MRVGIDAMGGDVIPGVPVKGALAARSLLRQGDRLVLVGRESEIRPILDESPGWADFIDVVNADEVIGMDAPPVETLRNKPNSSLAVMAELQRDGKLDASVSAGNTGAYVASAQMRLRRLNGVHRPGIAVITPTFRGPVAICDVGANIDCRPIHLHQYGVMASLYLTNICHVENPRVALLSVGEEDAKGNELVRSAHEMLRDDPNVNFIGNVESRDLFAGVCDVLVCDGFVGNVVIKLVEGMAEGVVTGLVRELTDSLKGGWGLLGGKIKKVAKKILGKYDFNEYGGAPLLGVGGICIICHGASNARGIMNAVRVALDCSHQKINEQIVSRLSGGAGAE